MPTEFSRQPCEDENGDTVIVIVWRLYPGLRSVRYTLEDGGNVNYVDERTFEIDRTGAIITRLV